MESRHFRLRYRVEVGASVACSVLFLLTLVRPDWIEAIFDAEPDGGSGEFEWLLVALLLAAALTFSCLAWRERRRAVDDAG